LLGVEVLAVHLGLAIIDNIFRTVFFTSVGCGLKGEVTSGVTCTWSAEGRALLQQLGEGNLAEVTGLRCNIDNRQNLGSDEAGTIRLQIEL
jgi:hypothetical protein